MKPRDEVKFTNKYDGNIPHKIKGNILSIFDGSVEVKFKKIGIWTVQECELKVIKKKRKKK